MGWTLGPGHYVPLWSLPSHCCDMLLKQNALELKKVSLWVWTWNSPDTASHDGCLDLCSLSARLGSPSPHKKSSNMSDLKRAPIGHQTSQNRTWQMSGQTQHNVYTTVCPQSSFAMNCQWSEWHESRPWNVSAHQEIKSMSSGFQVWMTLITAGDFSPTLPFKILKDSRGKIKITYKNGQGGQTLLSQPSSNMDKRSCVNATWDNESSRLLGSLLNSSSKMREMWSSGFRRRGSTWEWV